MPDSPAIKGEVEVTGKVDPTSKVRVITVEYGPQGMLQSSGAKIAGQLITEYEKLAGETDNPSVVIVIKADTAGSPLVRALVDMHKRVAAQKGDLICVGYPTQFLPALNVLGVPSLPGFRMRFDLAEAVKSAAATPANTASHNSRGF